MPSDAADPSDRPHGESVDLQFRIALTEDLDAVEDVFVTASAAPGHPLETRTRDEIHDWIDSFLDRPGELWLACRDDDVLGFLLMRGSWLSMLFVHPDRPARGVGAALMDLAKALRPQGFGLRVYQANERAREFYRRHGFVELESTDGSSYHDGEPDVQMAWLGEDPLAYLRGRIDAVDDELAILLARRAALTGAVQDQKEVGGHAGRDPGREAEIVERMARHVPLLGRARIASVMHTVIAESLAAWEERRDGSDRVGDGESG
jgi:chorismate mutase/GNAT superfamily N-acetyltransferase